MCCPVFLKYSHKVKQRATRKACPYLLGFRELGKPPSCPVEPPPPAASPHGFLAGCLKAARFHVKPTRVELLAAASPHTLVLARWCLFGAEPGNVSAVSLLQLALCWGWFSGDRGWDLPQGYTQGHQPAPCLH